MARIRLLDAGAGAVPTGYWRCGNCNSILPDGYWHQCPSITERRAA